MLLWLPFSELTASGRHRPAAPADPDRTGAGRRLRAAHRAALRAAAPLGEPVLGRAGRASPSGGVRHLRSPAARRGRPRRAQPRGGLSRRDRGRRPAPAHPVLARRRPRGDGRTALGHLRAQPPGDDPSPRAAGSASPISSNRTAAGSSSCWRPRPGPPSAPGRRRSAPPGCCSCRCRWRDASATSAPRSPPTASPSGCRPRIGRSTCSCPRRFPTRSALWPGASPAANADPAAVAARLLAHFSRGYTYSLQVPGSLRRPARVVPPRPPDRLLRVLRRRRSP